MTQEEKELLLRDLSGRLCYGIFVKENRDSMDNDLVIYTIDYHPCINDCKPYLRPMSSMTDEEKEELKDICTMGNSDPCSSYEFFGMEIFHISRYGTYFESDYTAIDWLNAHHFDYHRLIEKGLALEAPEDMYK